MAFLLQNKMYVSTCGPVSCLVRLAGYSQLRGGSRGKLGFGGAQGLFSYKRENNNEVHYQWRMAYTSYNISSGYFTSQRRAFLSNGEMRSPLFATKYETKRFYAARKRKITAVGEALVEGKQEESLEASVNLEEPHEKPSKSRRRKSKVSLIDHGKESLEAPVNLEEPHEKASKSRRTKSKISLIDRGKESLEASVNLEEPHEKLSKSRRTKSNVSLIDRGKESLEASVNLEEPHEKPSKARRTKGKDLLHDSSLVEEPVGIYTKSNRSRKKHDLINPDEESLEASVNLEATHEKSSKSRRKKSKELLQDCSLVEEPVGICTKSKRSRKKHDMINPDEESLEASVNLEKPHEKSCKSRRTKSKVRLIDRSKDLLQDSSLVEEPVGICTKSKRSRKKHVANPDEESLEISSLPLEPLQKPSKSRRTRIKVDLIEPNKELLEKSSKSRKIASKDVNPNSSLIEEPLEKASKSKKARKNLDVKDSKELLEACFNLEEYVESQSKSERPESKVALIDPNKVYQLEFDGASKGNPGIAGAGALLRNEDGFVICELQEGLGSATCNFAEYSAIILGLKVASSKGIQKIHAQGDSKLVCNQIQGLWKINSQNLIGLYKKAKKLKCKFKKFSISHIKREFNSEADALANAASELQSGEIKKVDNSLSLEKLLETPPKLRKTRNKIGLTDPNKDFYMLKFDGASKGNPGKAGGGAVLLDKDGLVICKVKEGLGIATNNVAEYRAVIRGLKVALSKGVQRIHVQGDSKLVCMQIQDSWKTKSENIAALNLEAKALLRKFDKVRISHIYREVNAEADALANAGINLKSGEWTSM